MRAEFEQQQQQQHQVEHINFRTPHNAVIEPFFDCFFLFRWPLAIFYELILHFCVVGAKDHDKGSTNKSPQG